MMILLSPITTNAQSTREQQLDGRQQSIIRVSALTGKGRLGELNPALHSALEQGLTINELKEIMIHIYAYAGFPRSIRGLQTLMSVLEERKSKGINDAIGKAASSVSERGSKYNRGKAILDSLTGVPRNATLDRSRGAVQNAPRTGYSAFAPQIEIFLKEHLFADIFERDVLTYAERELVTVSVLSSIGGVEPMLQSHFSICRHLGFSEKQLTAFVEIISKTIGIKESGSAELVLDKVVAASGTTEKKQSGNPYGLVYEGAITKNENGKINIHPVQYLLNGITIVANVYTPANYDTSKKYPAVVVAHPNGGIKEQTAGLYAQRLAEAGYITITADAAYQGASGGEPRHTDKPASRTEDLHGMADFITQYAGVDAEQLGVLGICGGGGYTLKAAQADKRFKAVATLSMFNTGEVRKNGFQNAGLNTIQERLKKAADARAEEVAGGKIIYAGVAAITDAEIAKIPTDLYREGYEYYYRTHAHPNSTFLYTMSSLLELMTWDATANMDLINQPLLMMAGSKADTKYMTDEAFQKATNARSKELFLIGGATHIQTYWQPEYVSQAVDKLIGFYKANL